MIQLIKKFFNHPVPQTAGGLIIVAILLCGLANSYGASISILDIFLYGAFVAYPIAFIIWFLTK